MMNVFRCGSLAVGFSALVSAACGGAAPEPTAPSNAASSDQATVGANLYGENCAVCHGAQGEGGGKAPPVVGKNALPLDPSPQARYRKSQFRTAADVFQFVKTSMPP